ncbi:MAG: hypothetical protein GY729_00900 [Desulfobacteraceae bacterium]|nr:hypothetical protein [Desulfobacteraceae bacterium]
MKMKSLEQSEKEHLEKVLAQTRWNLEKTSRLLKISLSQVKSKIKKYDLRQERP